MLPDIMGLHPNKHTISWKTDKLNMHLIHLTYRTSQPGLRYMYSEHNIQKRFTLCVCVPDWKLWFTTTAQHYYRALHITSLGKDQNSKFEVWFLLNAYHFYTIIKSKSH